MYVICIYVLLSWHVCDKCMYILGCCIELFRNNNMLFTWSTVRASSVQIIMIKMKHVHLIIYKHILKNASHIYAGNWNVISKALVSANIDKMIWYEAYDDEAAAMFAEKRIEWMNIYAQFSFKVDESVNSACTVKQSVQWVWDRWVKHHLCVCIHIWMCTGRCECGFLLHIC